MLKSEKTNDLMEKAKILIVEDDESIRTQMKWALAKDYQVFLAENRLSALRIVTQERPPVVTLDLGLPPKPEGVEEGFEALAAMVEHDPLTKVIIITGRGEKEQALEAVAKGAYDFFCKPIRIDDLKVVINRAVYLSLLEREHHELRKNLSTLKDDAFEGMVGNSDPMQMVFSAIRKVASTSAPVLITGESGTGKELAARAIHRLSPRTEGPFVAINCGAIPENLLESELFGHEKGAFTGAHAQKKGRIESAQGGTLFLDEIGDLPASLQVKLLRFLQDQKIVRVGGRDEITIDARILTATNTDLKEAISQAKFREDLYYRLAVVVLSMPPLKERKGDILLLAKFLLNKYATEHNKKISDFSAQARRLMESHSWPGNVRELENRIKRAVIMTEGARITPADLDFDSEYSKYAGLGLREAREALEKDFVTEALSKHKGNITQAAAELGISRPTLYELIEKLDIERGD